MLRSMHSGGINLNVYHIKRKRQTNKHTIKIHHFDKQRPFTKSIKVLIGGNFTANKIKKRKTAQPSH